LEDLRSEGARLGPANPPQLHIRPVGRQDAGHPNLPQGGLHPRRGFAARERRRPRQRRRDALLPRADPTPAEGRRLQGVASTRPGSRPAGFRRHGASQEAARRDRLISGFHRPFHDGGGPRATSVFVCVCRPDTTSDFLTSKGAFASRIVFAFIIIVSLSAYIEILIIIDENKYTLAHALL